VCGPRVAVTGLSGKPCAYKAINGHTEKATSSDISFDRLTTLLLVPTTWFLQKWTTNLSPLCPRNSLKVIRGPPHLACVPRTSPATVCMSVSTVMRVTASGERKREMMMAPGVVPPLCWLSYGLNDRKIIAWFPLGEEIFRFSVHNIQVNTLRTGSFKLFKRPFPGILTIWTH